LTLHGFGNRVSEFNRAAVELARSSCPDKKFVAGSVGPSGEFLEPMGTTTYEMLYDIFHEQIGALISAGVDLIIIETMSDVTEVRAAATAARDINPNIPLVLSMTFERSPSGFFTMMGTSPDQTVRAFEQLHPDAVGANCGTGAPEMIELMKIFASLTSLPLLAQANAGKPVLKDNAYFYNETPQQRGQYASELVDIGVRIIGGCCGTTPAHISAIRSTVDEKRRT
jgi:5-methyltetrahydrofolate--homocysteine methyltransferase